MTRWIPESSNIADALVKQNKMISKVLDDVCVPTRTKNFADIEIKIDRHTWYEKKRKEEKEDEKKLKSGGGKITESDN